ncbi:MAG: CDGSH iron-sulfur domain-containing protein [Gemmatimonadaceae bacterium]
MPLTIKVRNNGPYAIDVTTGEFTLVDAEGNPIPLPQLPPGKTAITLCRCGGSSRKPFCDGTHSKIGFKGAEEAAREFDASRQSGQPGPTGQS